MTHDRQADKSWWCDQTRTSRKLTGGIKVLKFHCVHAWTKRHSVSEVAMAAELSDHVYRHHSRHPYKCLQSTDLLFTHLITQFKKRAPKSVLHYIGIMLPHWWVLQLLHSNTLYLPKTSTNTTNRSVSCLSVLADMKLALLGTSSTSDCLQ